jgi:hypothetical protein
LRRGVETMRRKSVGHGIIGLQGEQTISTRIRKLKGVTCAARQMRHAGS